MWLIVLASLVFPITAAGQPAKVGGLRVAPLVAADTPLVAVSAGDARIVLSWSEVPGVSGYHIYRSTDGTWSTTPHRTQTTRVYTNSGLTNGTTYSYRVAGYSASGVGPLSAVVSGMPLGPPTGAVATAGGLQVTLGWQASTGATSYSIERSLSSDSSTFVVRATGVTAVSFVDTGLTSGTTYYYRLRAHAPTVISGYSSTIFATPLPAPPPAPGNVTATPGNARITIAWNAVDTATSYRVYRNNGGTWASVGIVTSLTFANTGLTNGVEYSYRVASRGAGGEGPPSATVSATPVAAPMAPTGVTAAAGNQMVTLDWAPVPGATGYKVYRGTGSNQQAATAIATPVAPPFVDNTATNGPTYYYKITATNAGGESPRSLEVSASPEAPAPEPDPATVAAFGFLRQATWGPRPGDVDALLGSTRDAFLNEQLAATPSAFPDALFDQPVEISQEHFMQLALNGPDQLRQRLAWALHKIWVVSAVEVNSSRAIVTYYRILLDGAFGNYRDLMRAVTLNPAMGRYLNMLNNRSQQVTGVPPNENYARELMQLFTLGIPRLNPNGTVVVDAANQPVPVYTENDVKELARILTGWTFGDGNPATVPTNLRPENYRVPMEAVAAYHDTGAKLFLGESFPPGQTAAQDLDQALDVIFRHSNVGPFISRQLIQQFVTSNPSPAYVAAVAAVFADNGSGVRGDLAAVIRAVLTHPEASLSTNTSGKLSEPVLFVVSQLRALNATVTDHPFMSDKAEEMGQKVFFPPSVFSYYSPGYRVRGALSDVGAPLGGPEFQILTTVTALVRVNFSAALLGDWFGDDVVIDYTPFTSRAVNPPELVDYVNRLLTGGRMSLEQRAEIISAVRASPSTRQLERARTALYLTLVAAQSQVDR